MKRQISCFGEETALCADDLMPEPLLYWVAITSVSQRKLLEMYSDEVSACRGQIIGLVTVDRPIQQAHAVAVPDRNVIAHWFRSAVHPLPAV